MISIIIPVYNEQEIIGKTLDSLSSLKDTEVVVVDGGSTDNTWEIVNKYPVKTLCSNKGRAIQMNWAAQQAKGEILVFLHADCRLEQGSLEAVKKAVSSGLCGGCLTQQIDSGGKAYRYIESSGNARAKRTKIFYGDQAIFVRRDVFFKIGGFDEVDVFEDVLFSRKLRQGGNTDILPNKVLVSARRWQRQGVVKTTLVYRLLNLGLLLGVPLPFLRRIYKDIR